MKDGKIEQGDHVLITGCTGGVGSAAVQIAKIFNARVTGTCSAKNEDFAKSLGVDNIILYDQEEIPDAEKFDLIFDAAGHFTMHDLKQHMTEDAMFVTTKGSTDNLKAIVDTAMDFVFQKRMKIVMMQPNQQDMEALSELIRDGKLKPYIARTFQLKEIAEAHQMMETGNFTGKIAIEIS